MCKVTMVKVLSKCKIVTELINVFNNNDCKYINLNIQHKCYNLMSDTGKDVASFCNK